MKLHFYDEILCVRVWVHIQRKCKFSYFYQLWNLPHFLHTLKEFYFMHYYHRHLYAEVG